MGLAQSSSLEVGAKATPHTGPSVGARSEVRPRGSVIPLS